MNSKSSRDFELSTDLVLRLTEAQSRMFGFLLKRLGKADQAHEVLQEVNLLICRKADEFEPGTDFMAWAFSIARFQVMAFRQRQARDRLVFPADLAAALEALDTQMFPIEAETERLAVLDDCMKKLLPEHQSLLVRRYAETISVKAIAAEMDRTTNAVSIQLHRLREQLMKCIESNFAGSHG